MQIWLLEGCLEDTKKEKKNLRSLLSRVMLEYLCNESMCL